MNTATLPAADAGDDYAELLARARAATVDAGLSDGTDRPATTAEEARS